jgi:hypothetical protein
VVAWVRVAPNAASRTCRFASPATGSSTRSDPRPVAVEVQSRAGRFHRGIRDRLQPQGLSNAFDQQQASRMAPGGTPGRDLRSIRSGSRTAPRR